MRRELVLTVQWSTLSFDGAQAVHFALALLSVAKSQYFFTACACNAGFEVALRSKVTADKCKSI